MSARALLVMACTFLVIAFLPPVVAAAPRSAVLAQASTTSTFQSVAPSRLVDTRAGGTTIDGAFAGVGPLADRGTLTVTVLGRAGIPTSGVDAVVLNITTVNTARDGGYLTVFPAGGTQPNASSSNYGTGPARATAAFAKVGDGGAVSIFAFRSTGLLVDVVGWFPTNGVYHGLQPARLADTRPLGATVDGENSGQGPLPAGGEFSVATTNRGGVPAVGVSAVVLTVTAANPGGDGFLTVYPSGSARPNASTLNFSSADDAVANLTVMDVSGGGSINVFASAPADVLVDVVGWFAQGGGFTPVQPSRILDTRPGGSTVDGTCTPGWKNTQGETLVLPVAGRGGVPATGAGAVILNVTVADSKRAGGFMTVFPQGTQRPNTSVLNYGVDNWTSADRLVQQGPVANLVVAQLSPSGHVALYNWVGAHDIVDVIGWIPGPSVATSTTCPHPLARDPEVVEISWRKPLTYIRLSGEWSFMAGTAIVTPPIKKFQQTGRRVQLSLYSDSGQRLGTLADQPYLTLIEDGDNFTDINDSFRIGLNDPPPGSYRVGRVCLEEWVGVLVNSSCRAARPAEAITVVVP